MIKIVLLVILVGVCEGNYSNTSEGIRECKQDWGHITIRDGAHMFWWLYYTSADVSNYTERPLIIWLQGGPGMPSSGYGNFLELGPFDINLEAKNYSVVEDFNVLFIDSPIGVGYSYYTNETSCPYPKNNKEIAEDLVRFLTIFMDIKEEFQNCSIYIFGESYGGKMAVEFAYKIMKDKKQKKKNRWNLKGIGLGNSYISPISYIRSYGPLALQLGLVDKAGSTRIEEMATVIENLINQKKYQNAALSEILMSNVLISEIPGVDVYNMVSRINNSVFPSYFQYVNEYTEAMNGEIKSLLNISDEIEWRFINNAVYTNLLTDLLKPVTKRIEVLLNNTDIKIIVYSGVLDFLVNTVGTRTWMSNLKWKYKDQWKEVRHTPFEVEEDIVEGYCKKYGNLMLYVIFRAGHSVPIDNMPAFKTMLKQELLCSEGEKGAKN